jgi:hypothetical protein
LVVGLLVWWEVGCQRVWVFLVLGYSFEPHCIGSLRSYLKPNRNSLQKPIGGRSLMPLFWVNAGFFPKRGRFVFAFSAAKHMLKKQETQPTNQKTNPHLKQCHAIIQ